MTGPDVFPLGMVLELARKAPRLFQLLHDFFERLSSDLPLFFVLHSHAVNVPVRTCGNAFGAGRFPV